MLINVYSLGSPRLAHGAKSMKRAMARHLKAPSSTHQLSHDLSIGADSAVSSTAVPTARALTPGSNSGHMISSSAPPNIQNDREPVIGGNDDDYIPPATNDNGVSEQQEEEDEGADEFQRQRTPEENAERAMRLMESREAESNKENQAESSQPRPKKRMTDRQEGAVRMTWNSQNSNQDGGSQQPHHRSSSDRQILRPISKRNATDPPETTWHSPAKRAHVQTALTNDEDNIQASQEPPRVSQVYNIANEAAKRMTALQPKAPQTRKPWTEEETERLLELIEKFGRSWKQLKFEDRDLGILENRDQVALKDKARNIKFDFLK